MRKMSDKIEQKKPRLKFSKLCLSQSRTVESSGMSNTQPFSSQISKFFNNQHVSDTEKPKSNNSIGTDENEISKICDNQTTQNAPESNASSVTTRRHKLPKTKSNESKTIKSFFANEINDSLSDFEIPNKIVKKLPKIPATKPAKTTRKRIKQADIRKVLNKNEDYSHLSEDAQIEVALALSKAESDPSDINLEKYQFKPSNGLSNKEFHEFFKMNRKARHKWNTKCTQLTRRQDDHQKNKIQEKIDDILCNNIIIESRRPEYPELFVDESFQVFSKRLQRICIPERILFEIGACEKSVMNNIFSYYTNNLVEIQRMAAGALLKDWSKIPGRDSIYDAIKFVNKTDNVVVISSESEPISEEIEKIDFHDTEMRDNAENIVMISSESEPIPETEESDDVEMKPSEEDDDENKTIILNSDDIQSQVDAINAKIRVSTNFVDVFNPIVVTHETSTTIRSPSPDLFEDDDEDDPMNNSRGIEIDKVELNVEQDVNNIESPVDAIVISSSESVNDSNHAPGANDERVEDRYTDVIELLDDSSVETNKISESSTHFSSISPHLEMPQMQEEVDFQVHEEIDFQMQDEVNLVKDEVNLVEDQANLVENEVNLVEEDVNIADDEFDKLTKSNNYSFGNKTNGSLGNSSKTVITKPLSFTERLQLYENDMLNGFTADIPLEHLNYSQQLSQDSITISDDEINYSMNINGKHGLIDDGEECENNKSLVDPIELNFHEPIPNTETEEKLINDSVCNIFERTFDHGNGSPIVQKPINKFKTSRTLKKVNSEMVFSSRASSSKVDPSPKKNPSQPNETIDLSDENYFIRVGSVSPKPNYEEMDTITLEIELRKFGLKPSLRRRQAIICLDYIYNRTHPFMENEEVSSPAKKHTSNELEKDIPKTNESQVKFNIGFAADHLVDSNFKAQEVKKVFLPSCPRAKKPWVVEPLHIAWHNLITANPELKKTVLMYEPIDLLELKKFFKSIDMTFDNRDLITFLDQHCITFRMNKNSKE